MSVWSFASRVSNDVTLGGNERWYLVHTLPRNEHRACLHLAAQGFRTYYPQIAKTVRHARKLRTVNGPLFPRYLFIILDPARDRWLSIQGTMGVSSLFICDGQPIPVPLGIVENIIHRMRDGNLSLLGRLEKGQRVRIMSGPFADMGGELHSLDDNGRVRVLLEMMGTAVPVAIDHARVLPAA